MSEFQKVCGKWKLKYQVMVQNMLNVMHFFVIQVSRELPEDASYRSKQAIQLSTRTTRLSEKPTWPVAT